mgnify:CR=1 FL=1|tara:strand:+ start:300 stop:1019 length:720 start_codon:yes stop_codon:yes gene_type:complete
MSVDLAIQLREGTKKAHTMAENTGFMSCFLKGVVDKATYRNLIADFYFVYTAMEHQIGRLSKEGNPVILPINYSELNRKKKLEEDLLFYFGVDWKDCISPTQSAKDYVERINKLGKENPELLVAHHYTRYIGDLSGGQMLKAIAQKAMNLPEHDGLRFYEFDSINNDKLFKDQYRATLDTLPINQHMADLIVAEANYAYECNMNIFQELEGNLIAAIGKVLFNFLTRRKNRGSTENKSV